MTFDVIKIKCSQTEMNCMLLQLMMQFNDNNIITVMQINSRQVKEWFMAIDMDFGYKALNYCNLGCLVCLLFISIQTVPQDIQSHYTIIITQQAIIVVSPHLNHYTATGYELLQNATAIPRAWWLYE